MCRYQPWEDETDEDHGQSTGNRLERLGARWEARIAMLEARIENIEARVERLETRMSYLQKGMHVVSALFLATLAYAIWK